MRYRTFGRTGWQISEIGFGAWQLGGDWGKVDDKASIDTLHYAFNKGSILSTLRNSMATDIPKR